MAAEQVIRPLLQEVVEIIRTNCFVEEYQDKASDEQCLGIAIAKYFEWDSRIVTACKAALDDANFHTEAAALRDSYEATHARG